MALPPLAAARIAEAEALGALLGALDGLLVAYELGMRPHAAEWAAVRRARDAYNRADAAVLAAEVEARAPAFAAAAE